MRIFKFLQFFLMPWAANNAKNSWAFSQKKVRTKVAQVAFSYHAASVFFSNFL
jgi:hypothetical protein